MAIKAVILDLDGTLLQSDGSRVAGLDEMFDDLDDLGLHIAIASNRTDNPERRAAKAGLPHDIILTRSNVRKAKGGVEWVWRACKEFEVESNEVVWLGDSDLDMRSAVNARVIYFNAEWSVPGYKYGLPVESPADFALVLRECMVNPVGWYWSLSTRDALDRPVESRTLMNGLFIGDSELYRQAERLFKHADDNRIGPLSTSTFLLAHLLGNVYSEGLTGEIDTWTYYPRSKSGKLAALDPLMRRVSNLFGQRSATLLIRHKDASDSQELRLLGRDPTFENQISTVHLNEAHRGRIEDRTIAVVDDFLTSHYSMECARNLLLAAGAKRVYSLAIGKFGRGSIQVFSPGSTSRLEPYSPAPKSIGLEFSDRRTRGIENGAVLDRMSVSYRRVAAISR